MLKRLLAVFVCPVLLECGASTLELGDLKVETWRRGAAMSALVYKGTPFVPAKQWSFTDRLCRDVDPNRFEYENTSELEWYLEPEGKPEPGKASRTYSIVPRAFDAFRLTKTYTILDGGSRLRVDWRFRNISDAPAPIGHSAVLRFLPGAVTEFAQPRGEKVVRYNYPGTGHTIEVSNRPGQRWCAAWDSAGGRGAVVVWPEGRTSGMTGWTVEGRREATLEYFGVEDTVKPGEEVSFFVEVLLSDDVPAKVRSMDLPVGPFVSKPLIWMRRYLGEKKPPAMIESCRAPNRFGRTFDFTLGKEFAGRTVVIDTDLESAAGLAVCPEVCDSPQYDRPYPAEEALTPGGKARLVVRMPKRCPIGDGQFRCRILERVKNPPRLPSGTLDPVGAKVVRYEPPSGGEFFGRKLEERYNVPVGYFETLCTNQVTYHERWFKPGTGADVLFMYWPARIRPYGDAMENGKRLLVELLQRANLDYRMLTLLPEVLGVAGRKPYGVYPASFADYLSDWTMARLRELEKPPRTVVINELDFRRTQEEAVEIFAKWKMSGTAFVFVDCDAVPERLLGKRAPDLERGLHLLPRMRADAPANPKLAQVFRQGRNGPLSAVCALKRGVAQRSPTRPAEVGKSTYPVPYGRDFPYFDYDYLPLLKALRLVAGMEIPARFCAAGADGLVLEAKEACEGTLEVEVKDLHRMSLGRSVRAVRLQSGTNELPFAEPPGVPGGEKVAHVRFLDKAGNVSDAAAFRFSTQAALPLEVVFSHTNRIYAADEEVALDVRSSATAAGCRFQVEVEGCDFRIVRKFELPGGPSARATFSLPSEPDRLYAVRVAAVGADGRVLARTEGEFSVRARPRDLEDIQAYITICPTSTYYMEMLRDLGFDYVISPFGSHYRSQIRQCALLNLQSVPRNCADDHDWFLPWRGDLPSAPAKRNPCFSDPSWRETLRQRISKVAEAMEYDYYNVRHHWLGDECFLGSNVCYADTCLAAFRAHLERTYGTLAELNREWGTSFGSFAEVRPCQLEELPDRGNLARWLDHKMFMAELFARNWAGGARELLREFSPGSVCGPTGTQVPGYGYDWSQMMKHVDTLGYYGGAQRKLVHDFADLYGKRILAGQCGGGYTHMQYDYEPYNYDTMWGGLLRGANLAYHYFGMALDGDISATTNMLYWAKSCRELKSGAGKLFLSGREKPEIAVLYSQSSLFAAMGSTGAGGWQGAQTSWWRVLSDLKFDFRFVPYEMLAEKGVDASFKAFVLPCSIALSRKEKDSLAAFVARGGLLLADTRPGVRDEHGKVCDDPDFAGLFDGRRGVLLGADVQEYARTSLGGTGGETASVSEGAVSLKRRIRRDVAAALGRCGVSPMASVTSADGSPYPCDVALREDGGNRVFAIHLDTRGADNNGTSKADRKSQTACGRFDFSKGDAVTARLGGKGHVYDVREGRYLGYTDEIRTSVLPGWTRLYSILQEKPGALSLDGPAVVRAGETARFAFAAGNAKGAHVFHIEFADPDGRIPWRFFRNVRTLEGGGSYALETAFNEKPGRWTATVVHVNTGARRTIEFEISR